MREEYDFIESRLNPYIGKIRQFETITIDIDSKVINYFKEESKRTGIPYQNIINLYLLQCVEEQKRVKLA